MAATIIACAAPSLAFAQSPPVPRDPLTALPAPPGRIRPAEADKQAGPASPRRASRAPEGTKSEKPGNPGIPLKPEAPAPQAATQQPEAPKPQFGARLSEMGAAISATMMWQEYGYLILGCGLFMIFQTVLIASLVAQDRRSKRAERELRESEERFRTLLDTIGSVSVQGYSPDGTVNFWNKASEALYGYSAKEALGRDLVDLIIPSPMRGEVRKAIANMAETGQPIPATELILRRKDGSLAPVFSSHAVVRMAEGRSALYCFDVDIGPLRRAEEALRASEERMRLLVENAGDAIYLTDMKGRIVDVNPEAERQTGFTRQELLNMAVLDLDVSQSPESMSAFAKLISTQHRGSFETRHRRKDGSSFPVDQRVVFLESEGRGLLLSLARDITARKRAEKVITEANQTLTVILDSVPADVNVVDAETLEILFMNKAMKETFRRDCTGETCHRAFRGRDDACENCTIPSLLASPSDPGGVSVWEDWNAHTARWCMNHDRALRWIDGRMARIQIATDISERKRTEQAMAASLHEKEILLREVHHRVKNNLQIISSLLNLQEQGLGDPAAMAVLAESRSRVMSMATIHEQLYRSRDFSEIDVDGYLRQILPRLVTTYKGDRNIALELEVVPVALALDQAIPFGLIINELATNALKHGFKDHDKGTLRVSALLSGKHLRLEVADDGNGLPEGFDLSNAETLGLQLVSSLAGQLKGRLEAVNGSGALFRLEFPVAKPRDFRAEEENA
ncbi:PAS domain S-box protein [Fundidesulfovibrio terrae]|uniref:PAS domain S-box protein n=1 Tax=Fundidesulfovibrio terrae TaxID=2922866 RepID=UPI001FAFE6BD|nr:PAS domain S-box protein [Fundidesulfovibrio terrae]